MNTVAGIFHSRDDAEQAVENLRAAAFLRNALACSHLTLQQRNSKQTFRQQKPSSQGWARRSAGQSVAL